LTVSTKAVTTETPMADYLAGLLVRCWAVKLGVSRALSLVGSTAGLSVEKLVVSLAQQLAVYWVASMAASSAEMTAAWSADLKAGTSAGY
jgi:hypothetical protein